MAWAVACGIVAAWTIYGERQKPKPTVGGAEVFTADDTKNWNQKAKARNPLVKPLDESAPIPGVPATPAKSKPATSKTPGAAAAAAATAPAPAATGKDESR